MYTDESLRDFAAHLASGSPVPGGGGAAAYCGAMGAALAAMVCHFTVGRPKFAAVDDEMRALADRSDRVREELVTLVDEDAAAFDAYSRATRLPRGTESEIAARFSAMQSALVACARVPLRIASRAAEVLDLCRPIGERGNPRLVSDAAVAALFSEAAMRAAILNVRVNLLSIKDSSTRGELQAAISRLEASAGGRLGRVMAAVEARLE
ncbi:MAG: hypothetical protein EPO26_15880 [Chloroflexota bacterium]|nr:MAG: hypothetical protein EPO26_15880 [Chloroflexota bacterium]